MRPTKAAFENNDNIITDLTRKLFYVFYTERETEL